MASIRHSRVGGNPGDFDLDSRHRGSDIHLVTYFWDTTREVVDRVLERAGELKRAPMIKKG